MSPGPAWQLLAMLAVCALPMGALALAVAIQRRRTARARRAAELAVAAAELERGLRLAGVGRSPDDLVAAKELVHEARVRRRARWGGGP